MTWFRRLPVGVSGSTVALCAVLAAHAGEPLLEDGFDGDLARWIVAGAHGVEIRESGDAGHGQVLELRAEGDGVFVLARGSQDWTAVRVEADFKFPTEEHAYLGVVFAYNGSSERADYGNVYLKGNGSYLRANPMRDGNVSRLLYEELKTPIAGEDEVTLGAWQRIAAEVSGSTCHVYVGDMARPKLTFDLFERSGGLVGFKPRVVGGPVWIDNVRIVAIDELAYTGAPLPDIEYQPEELVTDWEVLGPLASPAPAIEIDPTTARVELGERALGWRPFHTDARGAVVSGRVTESDGDETVAYFRTTVRSTSARSVVLHVSTTEELGLWVDGRSGGFVYRNGYPGLWHADWNAWYDFWKNPEHEGRRVTIDLAAGESRIVLRSRNGQFASGGFFARLETEAGERIDPLPIGAGDGAFDSRYPVEPELFVDAFVAAEGIAFAGDGALYVAADRGVYRASVDGGVERLTDLDTNLGLAGVGARDVLVADFGPKNVFRHGDNDDGVVWRVAPDGTKTVAARGIADPNFVLVRDDGSFLVSDDGTDKIYLVSKGGDVDLWTDKIAYPNGMVPSLDGSVLYVAQIFSALRPIKPDNRIWGLEVEDGRPVGEPFLVGFAGAGGVDGLALDARGRIYVADNGGGQIWRLDPTTGDAVLIAGGMPNIASLVFGEGEFDPHSIYAAATFRGGGRVWRVPVGVRGAPVIR